MIRIDIGCRTLSSREDLERPSVISWYTTLRNQAQVCALFSSYAYMNEYKSKLPTSLSERSLFNDVDVTDYHALAFLALSTGVASDSFSC